MKAISLIFILTLFVSYTGFTQDSNKNNPENQYIEWFGENEIANAHVGTGVWHLMNAEDEKAFTFFQEAIDLDSTLFAPHAALAWISWGTTRDYHVQAAKQKVEGKNKASRLFVSLLDLDNPREGDAYKIWKELFQLAPGGTFIHFYYARSIPNEVEGLNVMEDLLSSQKNIEWTAPIHNSLGYMHMRANETDKAKGHFKNYLELYPRGYNPYDSMGEFYLNQGDKEKAIQYFTKAIEHFPGAVNAIQMMEKIELEALPSTTGN